MYEIRTDALTWSQRALLAAMFALLAALLASLVYAMYAAHQHHEPGIVPAPVPVAPIGSVQVPSAA